MQLLREAWTRLRVARLGPAMIGHTGPHDVEGGGAPPNRTSPTRRCGSVRRRDARRPSASATRTSVTPDKTQPAAKAKAKDKDNDNDTKQDNDNDKDDDRTAREDPQVPFSFLSHFFPFCLLCPVLSFARHQKDGLRSNEKKNHYWIQKIAGNY